MNSRSSGKSLEGFFAGKGFYIVLFLCAAVIGVSAWAMAAGNEAAKDVTAGAGMRLDAHQVETIVIPPQQETAVQEEESLPVQAPAVEEEGLTEPVSTVEEESIPVWREGDVLPVEAPVYAWPVSGEIERGHSLELLAYDVTLGDWRTHEGIDILAETGTQVAAAHCGSVESIRKDDLYGMTVTLNHEDGSRSVYANLDEAVSVAVGDWLEPGAIIGTVGSTALCEIGQQGHLHFAMEVDGIAVNPLDYLPA